MKSRNLQLVMACCCIIISTACLKDTVTTTYTYKLYIPVYKTSAEVRANIITAAPQTITGLGKMYLLGKYIFLSDPGKGIHIINNSDPAQPDNEAYINIPGCEDMAVSGNTLYADCFTDLMAINIENPKQVVLKKTISNIFPDRQYVLGYQSDSGNVIVDWIIKDTTVKEKRPLGTFFGGPQFEALNNSASPSANQSQGTGGSMARFAIQSNHLYSVTTSKLNVLDITIPDAPEWKKLVELGWGIETIYPFKDKLFIGANDGMQIFSVSDPDNPEKAGTFEHVRVCDPVIADDNYAYVTLHSGTVCQGFTNQLEVVNVDNIADPQLIKTYPLTNPRGLSKDGQWLFICDGDDGLKVFDAQKVTEIKLKQTIAMEETYDVICMNGLAIVSAKDGLYQYDYSDINNIRLLSKTGIGK